MHCIALRYILPLLPFGASTCMHTHPTHTHALTHIQTGKVTVSGNQLLEDSRPIIMHGINYFGFNNAQTMVDGLWAGGCICMCVYKQGQQQERAMREGRRHVAVQWPRSSSSADSGGRKTTSITPKSKSNNATKSPYGDALNNSVC